MIKNPRIIKLRNFKRHRKFLSSPRKLIVLLKTKKNIRQSLHEEIRPKN